MTQPSMDLSPFAEAKVDRLTADDLIGGPRTIKITAVAGGMEDGKKQAILSFEGDEGKPFKPCKTMVRLMIAVWGKYASEYVGRSMTVYRDPDVTFGGLATGGVRISHMSHMEGEAQVIVAIKKGKKGAIRVKPLVAEVKPINKADPARKWADAYIAKVNACETSDDLNAFANEKASKLAELQNAWAELHTECVTALDDRRTALAHDPEKRPDDQMGEGFDPFDSE